MTHPWERESATGSGRPQAGEPPPGRGQVLFAWTMFGTSGSAALDDDRIDRLHLLEPGTTCGRFRAHEPPPSQSILAELRSKTQLTWAQLARALGVQRRSLHFWARGERPSAANLERLMRVTGIVRAVDRGDPAETTSALLEPLGQEPSLFALLCDGKDAEVLALLEARQGRTGSRERGRPRRPPPLSREERERRRGLPPVERLGALHDARAPEMGRLLASVPVPWRRG